MATAFYKHWRRAHRQVGHDRLHVCDLRHAAGTLAAWTGASEREVMSRRGRTNPAANRRYQYAARDRDRAITAGPDVILRGLQKSDVR